MNCKRLAKIFSKLIFGSIEVDKIKESRKKVYNEEIFEYFVQNWETTASSLKISNKHDQGLIYYNFFEFLLN